MPNLQLGLKGERDRKYPSLGVLRLEYDYQPAPGDIDSPESYGYPVFYRVVPGLTFEVCQSGTLTPQVAKAFDEAVQWLVEEKKVSAITGDCGFMMWHQRRIRQLTSIPVILSALTQVTTIATVFSEGTIIVMTANSKSLLPMKDLIRSLCGVDINDKRLHFVGCEDVPHFGEPVAKGLKVDTEKARPGIVARAEEAVRQFPDAKAVLMECTELPPYSDAVREATGLPVFDAITNCDFIMETFLDNPNFGNHQWLLEWNGQQEHYRFGKNVRPTAVLPLLSRLSAPRSKSTRDLLMRKMALSSTCLNVEDKIAHSWH